MTKTKNLINNILNRPIVFFLICLGLVFLVFGTYELANSQSALSNQREEELEAELEQLEREIAEQQEILQGARVQSASLQRDIDILSAEIREAELRIQAININIAGLNEDIEDRNQTIEEMEESIEKGKDALSQLIKQTNEIDSYSLVEIVLDSRSLSDIFLDIDNFESIKRSIHQHFEQIRETREELEEEKQVLSTRIDQETDARAEVREQQRRIEENEAEKERLLQISRSQERTYEQEVERREQRASEIRSALFELRDTEGISFGEALDYARSVEASTGIRPAFLLAVIEQESNLGQNVGTCNRPGDSLGWQDIMPGPHSNSNRNDQAVYLDLMNELGFDPDTRPLSCPFGNGWGGAMGPSQFIPTTWAGYKSRVASAVGVNPPNPWNPEHAFTASGIYLSDLGAGAQTWTSERNAACRYYSGRSCDNRSPNNTFYGNQVMDRADNFQGLIDELGRL